MMPLQDLSGDLKLRQAWPRIEQNDQYLEGKIDSHTSDTNNPHGVTAAQVGAETPDGAQAKADTVQGNLNIHMSDILAHLSPEDRAKFESIEEGAEVNQFAFATIGTILATSPTDTITFESGTGISITYNPTLKKITWTATGDATPGPHGPSHDPDGSDPIPALSALIDAFNALTAADIGAETPAGAQAKVDTLAGVGNTKTVKQIDDEVTAHLADYVRQPAFAATSGTSTAYTVTLDPAPTTLPEGFGITIVPHVDCGDGPTLEVNGLAAVALMDQKGVALAAGKMTAGKPYTFRLVGTDFLADSGSGGGGLVNGQTERTVLYRETISAQDPIYTQVDVSTIPAKIPNPSTIPTNQGTDVAYSPDGTYLAVSQIFTPFINIYKRSGNTYSRLPDPAVLPTSHSNSVAFSPDGLYLAISHNSSPFLTIYKRSGDEFFKLADPSSLPTGNGFGITFSPDGLHLVHIQQTSPYINIYKRSGDTFTKLANPSTLPYGYGKTTFSLDGLYLAVACHTTPFLTVYKRSGDTFTKLTDPAVAPTASAKSVAFSPDGTLVVAHGISPYITIYRRIDDTFNKIANPSALPTGNCYGITFSPDGNGFVVGQESASPFIAVYKRSGDTYVKQSNPGTLPSGGVYGVAFSPDGTNLALAEIVTPYVAVYPIQISAHKNKNKRDWLDAFEVGYAVDTGASGDTKQVIITHH